MHQENDTIGTDFGVTLEHLIAMLSPQSESGQRVFRRKFSRTTMGNPKWIRPNGHLDAQL
jgi:hypothetical protein